MKSLSKFAVILPFICLLLIAVMLFSALAPAGVASAEDAAFDIIYPESGYFPIENATFLAASEDLFVVYDEASDSFIWSAHSREKVSRMSAAECPDIDGIWLAGSVLLVSYGGDSPAFGICDLSSSTPSIADASAISDPANVSYIAADEERFYVKYDSYLTVYSAADLSVVGEEQVTLSPALIGPNIFIADNMTVYVYAAEYGDRNYYVLDLGSKIAESFYNEIYPYSVALSFADGIVYASNESGIVAVDLATSKTQFHTGIACTNETVFAVGGGRIYVLSDGALVVYSVTATGENRGAEYECTLAIRGEGEDLLSDPSDVLVTLAGTFIADKGNSRIVMLTSSSSSVISLPEPPVALAADSSGGIHVASENTVYSLTVSDGVFSAQPYCSVPEGERVTDIAHTGSVLVILTDSALYFRTFRGSPQRVADVGDGIALTAARGDVIYLMTAAGVRVFSAENGAYTPLVTLSDDFSQASGLAVDAAGTLFVSYAEEGRIAAFSHNASSLTLEREYTLTHPLAEARPEKLALDGSKAVFVSASCFAGVIEVGAVSSGDYHPALPDPDSASGITFAVIDSDTYLFGEPSRFDTVSPAAQGTVVLCYDGASDWADYTFVYFAGKTGYVDSSLLTPVSPSPNGGAYTVGAGSVLYPHPVSDNTLTLSEDAVITVTDNAAGLDDGAWARASYGGSTYFVRADALTPYTPPVPEREEKFGRASADRAGGIVNIYSLPDLSSASVAEVVDGTRMEILGEDGDFWLVSLGDITGYAAKSEVELEGLTTVQIVSIVLCCAVAVTGVVVFVVLWQARKKEKEKE